jgi:REP element-mobilizing transposase RayT
VNVRSPFQDYRAPAFYLVTMVALNRRPLFAACADGRATLTEDGWLAHNLWKAIPQTYPAVQVSTLCIMPDHLHGIVRVKERMEQSVGVPLRAFKSQVTSALRKKYGDPHLAVWEPGYHDLCVWRYDALHAYTRYIQDNPRRYCLKKEHPDLFRSVQTFAHPALAAGHAWSAFGNRFLLDRPERLAVRVSRSASPEELARVTRETLAQAARGVVVVSPFISHGEKAVANAILDAPVGDVILLKPDGFPPLFKPKGRYFDLCARGRLLILTPNLPPEPRITRETCLTLNAFCAEIAQKADGVNAASATGLPAAAFMRT